MRAFKLILTLFFLCVLTENGIGQADLAAMDDNIEWSEGQIKLNKGDLLKGVLRFNSKSGLLTFQNGNESKTLTSRSVQSFEYFDAIRKQQRRFYSIEIEDGKGIVRPQFVEVLKELKKFAVISTENPLQLKKKSSYKSDFWDPADIHLIEKTSTTQMEILYLMDTNADITPYLIINTEETSKNLSSSKTKTKVKTKLVGREALETLTKPHSEVLKKYAKENKLEFDDRADFLKIIDHYAQLTAQD